jgi:hypothetical protein
MWYSIIHFSVYDVLIIVPVEENVVVRGIWVVRAKMELLVVTLIIKEK